MLWQWKEKYFCEWKRREEFNWKRNDNKSHWKVNFNQSKLNQNDIVNDYLFCSLFCNKIQYKKLKKKFVFVSRLMCEVVHFDENQTDNG